MKKICITVSDDLYNFCKNIGDQLGCSTTAATSMIVQVAAKQPKTKQVLQQQNVISVELQKSVSRYASELKITPDEFIQKLIQSYNAVMSFNIDWRKQHGI